MSDRLRLVPQLVREPGPVQERELPLPLAVLHQVRRRDRRGQRHQGRPRRQGRHDRLHRHVHPPL
jgi:hypothetical protein